MLKLLYFMKLAEIIGTSQEEIQMPQGLVNVGELLRWLGQRGEQYRTALGDGSNFQVTINKKFVDTASAVKDGDEIAFFPTGR